MWAPGSFVLVALKREAATETQANNAAVLSASVEGSQLKYRTYRAQKRSVSPTIAGSTAQCTHPTRYTTQFIVFSYAHDRASNCAHVERKRM